MLGRALDRQGEFAVHKALGAPAWRLFNRGIAEAIVLAAVGGALGLFLATGLVRLAERLESILPRPVSGGVEPGVLGFAVAVTVGSAILFGVAPALHAARTEVGGHGRGSGRTTTATRRGQRLRRLLVVSQLAMTTVLLIGAGLLGMSFQRIGAVDLGIETESVISVELHGSAWWNLEPDAAIAQWSSVMQAIRAIPGVESAGAIDYVPLGGSYSCDGVRRDDLPPPEPGRGMCAETRMTLPGALDALGVTVLRGRGIQPTDQMDQPHVVVIDERLADALWPDTDPIGMRMHVHGNVHEVVGVAANMLHFGPVGDVRPQLYLHAAQDGWNGPQRGLTLLVRGADPGSLAMPIRSAVSSVNASIAVGIVETLDGFLATALSAERFRTALMLAFATTALLLALLGVAGTMSYSVARRRREMGLRLALGAEPLEVRQLVLREGARLSLFGIGSGVLTALVLAGALDGALLFEIGSRDPGVYTLVVVLLAAMTSGACYVPARRASKVDPVTALQEA